MYSKIYILGAGFSKAFCSSIPTMKVLLNNISDENEDFKGLSDYIKEIQQKGNNTSDFDDVENIVSYILSYENYCDYQEELVFMKIRSQLIKYIYRKLNKYGPDKEKVDQLKKFIRYCAEKKILLISFNYDLFIENVCKQINEENLDSPINYNYGIRLNPNPFKTEEIIDGGSFNAHELELLKPHGSFNWRSLKDTKNINYEDVIEIDEERDAIFSKDAPLYIPMTNSKSKYYNGNYYKIIWKKIRYYLNNADEINFIGYGFPKTDFDDLIIFLDYKQKIKNIVICYDTQEKEEEGELERLKKIFKDSTIHNCDAIDYIKQMNTK
jgi:hypothetical protein